MEVILKDDIKGLGYKNDTVNVKPGYGRNYLIPRGYAIIANSSNKKSVNENIRQAAHKAEKLKKDAVAISEKISNLSLVIPAKVGESGKIFGAVTVLQLSEKGVDVDRKKISFNSDVKEVGEYTAQVDLHKEVKVELKFSVVAG
jgi:large subunit ribosomal protein L9